MDASSSSAALPRPRLRLFRRSPSPHDPADATPQPARPRLTHDEDEDVPAPRVQPIASLHGGPASLQSTPAPTETPAARLRALLAREQHSPSSTTPTHPPAPPSEADSAAEHPRLASSTASLRDIFSRALREPGDTPQKGRPRRNSFDGSSMEITPVVDRHPAQRRVARRSLSDEEAENPKSTRRSDPSFRLSSAITFDSLRARFMSSQSRLVDQNFVEALYDQPSIPSTSTSSHLQPSTSSSQLYPARVAPPVSATTPHPSFQMSSQLALQSNLLEQDSEMQRAMGDVLSSDNEASTSSPNVARQPTPVPSSSRPSSSFGLRKNGSGSGSRRASHELGSSTNTFVNGRTDREHHSQEEERNHQREREWNRPRLPSGSSEPDMQRRHSQELHRRLSQEFRSYSHTKSFSHESVMSQGVGPGPVHRPLQRRGSHASLRSFDDDHSSRPSSVGSQADYHDRVSELERERNHELEREWNKRHPPSRPSSSLSTSSNHSFSHSHSHPPRSPSAIPYLTPTHASLQRKSSRSSLRSDSPVSLASSRDSLKERVEEEKQEVAHERERNWNSPRPHWSTSKSPSTSPFRVRKDSNSPRTSRLRDSNGHQDASRVPTKLQGASSKVDVSSSTLPALLHHPGGDLDLDTDEGVNGHPHSSLDASSLNRTPGSISKFGWNFARSPLPPLELDDSTDHRKSTFSLISDSRPSNKASEAVTSSQIPVRSRMKNSSGIGHATSDMSLTHVVGDESSSQQNDENGRTLTIELRNREEPPATRFSRSEEDIVLASDEESVMVFPFQSTTPKSDPPKPTPDKTGTDTETEVLSPPSPRGSPQSGVLASIPDPASPEDDPSRSETLDVSLEGISATPPGTPPPVGAKSRLRTAEVSPSSSLVTPPRQTSFGSSILDFRTPSPPHDLPDLPGPPSSSDDDALGGTPLKDRRVDANPNFTLIKTPKLPGAWAATPLPPKFGHQSASPATTFDLESTPPAFTSTPLPRTNTYPPTHAEIATDSPGEDGLVTPMGSLSRARSLPLRTPAPPGAWMTTPGQSVLLGNGTEQSQYGSLGRRKGQLKVRFDVAESEASATEGHPHSPLSAIRLTHPGMPDVTTDQATDDNVEAVADDASQTTSMTPVSHRPPTPDRPATPSSRGSGPSPRSLRKSPVVRLVDAYGRERADEGNPKPPTDLSNGYADAERKTTTPPSTPRRSSVRIVDAMGREFDGAGQTAGVPEDIGHGSFEADISVVSDDSPIGHGEALARMRKVLRDLAEGLSDADRSEDIELDSTHLEQLEEVSQAARLARNQLAHNLQLETAKQRDLQRNNRFSAWTRRLLPVTTRKPWNTTIIYCSVIIQLLLVLAMWRYAHAEARRLFYTTYYDPLYPEFTPIQRSSYFSGTFSTTRPWTFFDSYETVQREGWSSIGKEMLRAMRHVGDQVWERWGEHAPFEKPT